MEWPWHRLLQYWSCGRARPARGLLQNDTVTRAQQQRWPSRKRIHPTSYPIPPLTRNHHHLDWQAEGARPCGVIPEQLWGPPDLATHLLDPLQGPWPELLRLSGARGVWTIHCDWERNSTINGRWTQECEYTRQCCQVWHCREIPRQRLFEYLEAGRTLRRGRERSKANGVYHAERREPCKFVLYL